MEVQEQLSYDSRSHAARYLLEIAPEDRRAAGQVYTPGHLADFVLSQAGFGASRDTNGATLLDPSCGCGVFLERAVLRLAATFAAAGLNPEEEPGRSRFIDTVAETVYGVDIDRRACALARRALRAVVASVTASLLPADRFDKNIVEADFLLSSKPALLGKAGGGFAFIVGNPPYVSATRIDRDYKDRLRESFESAGGRLDLYVLFIERSLSLLQDGGRLAFITPDKFLVSQSARRLRSVIERDGSVTSVARFPSHKVFDNAATVPCVSVIERVRGPREVDAVDVFECAERATGVAEVKVLRRWQVPRVALKSSGWQLSPPHLRALEEKMMGGHRTLAQISERISAGVATGRDSVYVLHADAASGLEEELLRPAVRGRDLSASRISDPNLRVLVPYGYDTAGRPELVEISRYPHAHAYLSSHRAELEQRHCVRRWRKSWYDVHDPIPGDLAARPKILVPDVAHGSRFAFDEGRYLPLHSVYYIVLGEGVDPQYITALLNSRPLEFLIRLRSPKVKDGFSRFRRQFLEGLPLPGSGTGEPKRIVEAAAVPDIARLNELVAASFGLSDRDVEHIDEFLGPPLHRDNADGRTVGT